MKGFFIPIIELVIIGAFIIAIVFIVYRAFNKVYSTKWKWFIKYTIFRVKYDPATVEWGVDAIENDYDYWMAKRYLLLKGIDMDRINETMWIFNKLYKELKGGMNNGQRNTRNLGKTQSTETASVPRYETY